VTGSDGWSRLHIRSFQMRLIVDDILLLTDLGCLVHSKGLTADEVTLEQSGG
jgi:hypothetical protein